MYSRIIQIESFPVSKDNRIAEDTYIGDHWFMLMSDPRVLL